MLRVRRLSWISIAQRTASTRAGKLGQHRIACGVENAAAGLGDEVVDDGTIGSEPPQRLLFILGYQPAVTGNIGSEDRRYLALHDGLSPKPRFKP
jgi:hypothetical protein